jgi:hypothetical protein
MSADSNHNDPNDDPTRALDDFVRRMRPSMLPPTEAPDLSDLRSILHPQHHRAPSRPKGNPTRGSKHWDVEDVVDVPEVKVHRSPPEPLVPPEVVMPKVNLAAEAAQASLSPEIDLPEVSAPAPLDALEMDEAVRHASDFASSQWDLDEQAAAAPVWQPDLQALHLKRPPNPRLLTDWQPGAWIGAVREVFDSTTEFITTPSGPAVETYPPHRLLLLWPPQPGDGPLMGRWPQQAHLSAVPADEAAEALLNLLPGDALLWVCPGIPEIDWVLGAELVLHHEPQLRPFQLNGLRAFVDFEREANFARLNDLYTQRAPGEAVTQR